VPTLLRQLYSRGRIYLAIAAPIEIRAVLAGAGSAEAVPDVWKSREVRDDVHVLHIGVGKANAAGALAAALAANPAAAVINIGIAGALPIARRAFAASPGQTVAATRCVFGDEGIVTAAGFSSVAAMGFPMTPGENDELPCDEKLLAKIAPLVSITGPISTVSTCSGTDSLAHEVARRTDAVAETMEGAACALVCRRFKVPFLEVRAISNFTGERAQQAWDIKAALASLETLTAAMMGRGR
jgi:futalosine hydrolase